MLKRFIITLKKNLQIFLLISIILTSLTASSYLNYQKKIIDNNYNNFIENIFLKKTLNHILDNLTPKYKKINHKIKSGETFDKILKLYKINNDEIIEIKKNISKEINLNKLNTKQTIQISFDQINNKINEFTFQISNTQKIYLKRDVKSNKFNQEILNIKLQKEIIYKENIIIQSLYKAATDQDIPANTIIDFARIYGFQVDFQRDIRKQDKFQIMYEVFVNEKKKIIQTGEILYANLKLSGQDNSLYYFDDEKNEGHYDKNGKSIQKALMKTPINGA